MDKYAVGVQGEAEAKSYLESIGYVIKAQNVSFHNKGELDIVAIDGNTLVFVEVKTRSDCYYGNPVEAMTKTKIKRVIAASRRYLSENKGYYAGYRYDVIGILPGQIKHIKNAFYAHW